MSSLLRAVPRGDLSHVTVKVPSNLVTLRLCGPILAISVYILAWHLTQQYSLLFTKHICQDLSFLQMENKDVSGQLGFTERLIALMWCSLVEPSWDSLSISLDLVRFVEPCQ